MLEALAASCTQLAAGWSRGAACALASDVAVASALLALHGATLMSQVGRGGVGPRALPPPHAGMHRLDASLPGGVMLPGATSLHCFACTLAVPPPIPVVGEARPCPLPPPPCPAPAQPNPPPTPGRQAMVFGVAMNSKKNTLVALLIAANFTEIKGEGGGVACGCCLPQMPGCPALQCLTAAPQMWSACSRVRGTRFGHCTLTAAGPALAPLALRHRAQAV